MQVVVQHELPHDLHGKLQDELQYQLMLLKEHNKPYTKRFLEIHPINEKGTTSHQEKYFLMNFKTMNGKFTDTDKDTIKILTKIFY